MTPSNIVRMAHIKGLDVLALTDHNSLKNTPAFMQAAGQYKIIAIPGIEVCTIEDVHVIGLFPTLEDALGFDEFIYGKLTDIENNPKIFGNQYIYNERDEIIASEPKLLISGALISIDEAYEKISSYNGVMIPAHIDRPAYSLIANLGFVPENSMFTCVELKDKINEQDLVQNNPYLKNCNVIYNSDAHYLYEINERDNYIEVENATITDILNALKWKINWIYSCNHCMIWYTYLIV